MNIMIVSPAYAPYTGVGANRMMSLSVYLIKMGFDVTVLRNAPELWPENSRKSTVPEGVRVVDVYAVGSFEECKKAYYEKVESIITTRNIDISIYSCNPYYTAPVAREMKLIHNAKYIIDFRDLWIKDEALTRSILRIIKKYLVRLPYHRYEKECIEAADAVLTVTPKDCQHLQKQYPKYSDKIQIIFNGYDESRINQSMEESLKLNEDYIGIFGKFGYYDYKYVVEMLKSVKKLNSNGFPIKIVHIGDCDRNTLKALEKTEFPKELYINPGFLDYSEGMKILSKAKLNCLIVHYKRGLGTKLFDYIYLNKPIVYFAHADSSISQILKTCKTAFCCNNAKDSYSAIETILKNDMNSLGCQNISLYSRDIQNQNFCNLMKQICKNSD